jgi:diphthine-ammonia ligase
MSFPFARSRAPAAPCGPSQARNPDIEAVASGAIASDYQRLRVEDVCARLGLVSLAYLWHRPQEELLE